MTEETLLHGTCVALDGAGVLLRGPSGSGKSDLALRLIDGGARLISDDQTFVASREGRLIASAPPPIEGRIEARGLGILSVNFEACAPLALIVDLVSEAPERLPEPESLEILGVELPLIHLCPFEASAAAKLRLAVHSFASDGTRVP